MAGARAIANGSKERRQPRYKKEDSALPTVANNSVMITATIDAHKCCNVATVDILGASSMHTTTRTLLCSYAAASPNSWYR
jgi:hypothetical protein